MCQSRMVHETDIVEMELKSKKFTLAVRKKEAIEPPEPIYVGLLLAIGSSFAFLWYLASPCPL